MKLAVMQPYFFPYIGYIQLLKASEKFVMYDDVTFIKGGWINRNRIIVNNNPMLFTVPLANASSNTMIKDLQVASNVEKWRHKFLKTIEGAYKKAPFFNETANIVNKSILINSKWFIDWLIISHEYLNRYLKLEFQSDRSSNFSLGEKQDRTERLVAICRKQACDIYINPQGGQTLYRKSDFKKCGIDLLFIKNHIEQYQQFAHEFIPGMSIIDVMMFVSPKAITKYLCIFELT